MNTLINLIVKDQKFQTALVTLVSIVLSIVLVDFLNVDQKAAGQLISWLIGSIASLGIVNIVAIGKEQAAENYALTSNQGLLKDKLFKNLLKSRKFVNMLVGIISNILTVVLVEKIGLDKDYAIQIAQLVISAITTLLGAIVRCLWRHIWCNWLCANSFLLFDY